MHTNLLNQIANNIPFETVNPFRKKKSKKGIQPIQRFFGKSKEF